MNPTCLDQMEVISAWIDGEASPAEADALKCHLEQCSHCREVAQAMRGLGESVAVPEKAPLSPDFALQTAHLVRQRAGRGGPWSGLPGGWSYLRSLWNHPVCALLGRNRRRAAFGWRESLKVMALFTLPSIALALLGDRLAQATYFVVCALGLGLGLTMRHWGQVAVLGSLRRGRCLDEVLSTGIGAASLVDAIALDGCRDLIKTSLPLIPAALVGAASLPTPLRLQGELAAVSWMPLLLMLFVSISYGSQVVAAWSGSYLPTLVMALGGLAGIAGYWATGWVGLAALGLLTFVLGLWLARWLAIRALEQGERVEMWLRPRRARGSRRPAWVEKVSSNPIALRELTRVSQWLPGGLGGLLLLRLSTLVLPLLWGLWACTQTASLGRAFWTGVAMFAVVFFGLAARRTLPAIVHEREKRTWEPLLQSGIDARTFLIGWLQVALYTVVLEGGVAVSALLLFAAVNADFLVASGSVVDGLRTAGLASLVMFSLTGLGALVGLAISSQAPSTREAPQQLAKLTLTSGIALMLAWAAVAGLGLYFTGGTSNAWDDFLRIDCLLASVVVVATGLVAWSRAKLRAHLTQVELPLWVASESKYPLSLIPLELAGLCWIALGIGVVMLAALTRGRSELILTVGVPLVLMIWFGLIRLPLAWFAELCSGSSASLLAGGLNGLVLAAGLPSLVLTCAAALTARQASWMETGIPAVQSIGWLEYVAVGGILGIVCGELARRAQPPQPARVRLLRRRILLLSSLSLAVVCLMGWAARASYRLDAVPLSALQDLRQRVLGRVPSPSQLTSPSNGFNLLRVELLSLRSYREHPWRILAEHYDSGESLEELMERPGMQRARASLLADLARIRRSLDAPEFLTGVQLDHTQRLPNFIMIRSLAQSLCLVGQDFERRGQHAEAFELYLLALRWGDRLSGQPLLISEMIATAVEQIALERILVLESRGVMTAAEYRELIRTLEKRRMQPEAIAQSLESEFVAFDNLLQKGPVERAKLTDSIFWAGLALPKFHLDYERQVFGAVVNASLKSVRELKYYRVGDEFSSHVARYPNAFLTQITLPNFARATTTFANCQTRLEGLRLVAALQLYRLDHGNWPERLDQLVGPYLSSMPRSYANAGGGFDYRVRGEKMLLDAPGLRLTAYRTTQSERLYPYPPRP